MMDVDQVWQKYASQIPGLLERRPDFRFDPDYYALASGLAGASAQDLAEHYRNHGAPAGLPPTRYADLIKSYPQIDETLRGIVNNPDLDPLVTNKTPDALELLCELIGLGDPVDATVSDFSGKWYLDANTDLKAAKVDPVYHYLCFGAKEGRKNLGDLREAHHVGAREFRSDWPTCLICVHEMSRTGAPIVGLDLAREASATHNVVVAALRDGPLLEDFKAVACEVAIADNPVRELNAILSVDVKKIDFAIVNSAAATNFLYYLVKNKIPLASYVHEYTQYMYPAFLFNVFPLFSDLMVFSSDHVKNSWKNRFSDINFDAEEDSVIIPQRPFYWGGVDAAQQTSARQRLSRIVGRDLSTCRIVCGAGQSQWRKGTDLFAIAAQICRSRDPDTVFIWIGHGIQHDEMTFGAYMSHHLEEIAVGGPDSNLFFIEAGPAYKDLLAAADAMFLSSRLDPLPNVVFDALEYGCKIVQFDGGTGFGDEVYTQTGHVISVEYGNPEAALQEILKLPRKSLAGPIGRKPDFPLFEKIRTALMERIARQRYFVAGTSQIDEPMMFTSDDTDAEPRALERRKMFTYGRRRLWRDLDDVTSEVRASDNWVHRKLRLEGYEPAKAAAFPKFSLHVHAHYTDELAADMRAYPLYRHAHRIVVTTDTDKKADAIRKIMAAQDLEPEIVLCPNKGRDILPFIKLFETGGAAGSDELWCHIHQKKSLASTAGGDKWRRFLLRILFGSGDEISNALEILALSEVGLVAPFDPHYLGWDDSRRLLPKFANRLPGPFPHNPLLFPVGNMFWVRRSVVMAMNRFFGPDYVWPGEPIANDGTEYHLIERLWPAMAASLGLESVFVHKLDEKRL